MRPTEGSHEEPKLVHREAFPTAVTAAAFLPDSTLAIALRSTNYLRLFDPEELKVRLSSWERHLLWEARISCYEHCKATSKGLLGHPPWQCMRQYQWAHRCSAEFSAVPCGGCLQQSAARRPF